MNCRSLLLIALIFSFAACKDKTEEQTTDNTTTQTPPTPFLSYTLVKQYPHDVTSFTEGLLIHEGKLYESTGAPEEMPQTRSLFGVVDMATGKINVKAEIDRSKYFGEGITFLNGKVYMLTWQTKVGFVFDAKTFKQIGTFTIPAREGWGMTTDGTHLIMSDGSNTITYFDPNTYATVKTLSVTDNGLAVMNLNELEYVNGFIYANVYTTNIIVKIDAKTGNVAGKLDLNSLAGSAMAANPESLEMNGIAYDSTKDNFYITGKFWPQIFEIKLGESVTQ